MAHLRAAGGSAGRSCTETTWAQETRGHSRSSWVPGNHDELMLFQWLNFFVRRRCLSHRRHDRRDSGPAHQGLTGQELSSQDLLAFEDARDALQVALSELSPQ